MRRIWVDKNTIKEPSFELVDEAFRHAVQVSRFREGEEFEIIFGDSYVLRARLAEIRKKSAQVEVLGRRELAPLPQPWINLAFGISKWPVFEEVVEKAVELGVHTIQPLMTDFSFVRKLKDWPDSRRTRWQKIIQSATEQSGRGSLLVIKEPLTLQEFTKSINPGSGSSGLFAYEGESALDIATALKPLKNVKQQQVWAIVGSEGGFSADEVQFMQRADLPPVTLGTQILRAETACFAMVSVIKYELGLMRGQGA